ATVILGYQTRLSCLKIAEIDLLTSWDSRYSRGEKVCGVRNEGDKLAVAADGRGAAGEVTGGKRATVILGYQTRLSCLKIAEIDLLTSWDSRYRRGEQVCGGRDEGNQTAIGTDAG